MMYSSVDHVCDVSALVSITLNGQNQTTQFILSTLF